VTVIVDVLNEDDVFEALHFSWLITKAYPPVSSVVDGDQSPDLLQGASARL